MPSCFRGAGGADWRVGQYSDAQLYTQLRYYAYLFDVWKPVADHEKGDSKRSDADIDGADPLSALSRTPCIDDPFAALKALSVSQGALCAHLKGVADKYLSQSGRRWVQMSTLFSFMKI